MIPCEKDAVFDLMKEKLDEIGSDVKVLLAAHNRNIGAEKERNKNDRRKLRNQGVVITLISCLVSASVTVIINMDKIKNIAYNLLMR